MEESYLYEYSSLMKGRTSAAIARRHIHIYALLRSTHTTLVRAHRQNMTQFRKIIEILLVSLYAIDPHCAGRTSLVINTQYLENIT